LLSYFLENDPTAATGLTAPQCVFAIYLAQLNVLMMRSLFAGIVALLVLRECI
jgi:hypothetical protein